MNDSLLQLGDEVRISPYYDNWGAGALATIVEFDEMHWGRNSRMPFPPGVHVRTCQPVVQIRSGNNLNGHREKLWSSYIRLVDTEEEERRQKDWEARHEADPTDFAEEFIRPLPDTPFWEGDKARVVGGVNARSYRDGDGLCIVTSIDFRRIGTTTAIRTPYPIYTVTHADGSGGTTSFSDEDLVLVSRGNIWRHYHDEALVFGSIRSEARFYQQIGRTREVHNPNTENYRWTREEAIAAISQGVIHDFGSPFMSMANDRHGVSGFRYTDDEVGERVAAARLEEFGVLLELAGSR